MDIKLTLKVENRSVASLFLSTDNNYERDYIKRVFYDQMYSFDWELNTSEVNASDILRSVAVELIDMNWEDVKCLQNGSGMNFIRNNIMKMADKNIKEKAVISFNENIYPTGFNIFQFEMETITDDYDRNEEYV